MKFRLGNRGTRLVWLAGLWLGIAVLPGCGGSDGPPRYELSGTATFNGEPIPYGTITITPDTSQGNSGPGSFAQIRDGQYETASSKGTVGGPHVLTISGFDELPGTSPPEENHPPLFTSYRVTVNLPLEDATHDIDVPASAAEEPDVAGNGVSM